MMTLMMVRMMLSMMMATRMCKMTMPATQEGALHLARGGCTALTTAGRSASSLKRILLWKDVQKYRFFGKMCKSIHTQRMHWSTAVTWIADQQHLRLCKDWERSAGEHQNIWKLRCNIFWIGPIEFRRTYITFHSHHPLLLCFGQMAERVGALWVPQPNY